MLKYFSISFINAIYYPVFMASFAAYHYEHNLEFYLSASGMILLSSYPLLKWMFNLHKNILFKAYFITSDIFFKLIPFLILSSLFLFKNNINQSFHPYILATVYFIVLLHIMVKLICDAMVAPLLLINHMATFRFTGVMGIDLTSLHQAIKQFTDSPYFIIDDGYTHENTITICSSTLSVIFNYHYNFFAIDGVIIDNHILLIMQEEYQKLLFNMSDDELESIKMFAI